MTIKQLQAMIKWLRAERISYSSLIANGFELHGVVDGKTEATAAEKPQPRPSMYERFGAELLKQPTAKPSEVVPDEALSD
jgi:hypothetical protein